ncbi:MAG TPA: hypothetical protein VF037_11975 [Gemmatimonadales bacterium]
MARAAALAAALLAAARPAGAQDAAPPAAGAQVVAGTVLRITARDTVPAAGATVVLHRIGRDRQGPLDSTVTDPGGRFRFRYPADSASLHILTSRHHGIQYFSEPVHSASGRPDTTLVLAVHDTSSRQPVSLAARHIVLSAPAQDGTRNVVELVAVTNAGPLTRVPDGPAGAAWTWPVPAGAVALAVAEGELPEGAVTLEGDRIAVRAPLPPGLREITVEYVLPPGIAEARFPFDSGAASVNLLVEEADADVTAPGLAPADSVTVIEARSFRRWTGAVAPGGVLVARVPVPGRWGRVAVVVLVVLVAFVLAWVTMRVLRRPLSAPVAAGSPDAILDEIVRVDAMRAAVGEGDPAEAARLEARRAELKARLAAALARPGGVA